MPSTAVGIVARDRCHCGRRREPSRAASAAAVASAIASPEPGRTSRQLSRSFDHLRQALGMLEEKDMTVTAPLALRGEDGAVREDFVERVAQAIDAARFRAAARAGRRPARGRCRRPDRGARSGAAPAPRRADGARLRLLRADRGRRHRPRGDPRGAAGRDRRRRRARARFRRRGRHPRRPAEGRAGGDPRAASRRRARSRSRAASTIRKTPPAGACRPSSSRSSRIGRSGRPSTTCARRPICRTASGSSTSSIRIAATRARSRSTACCAPSGRCRSPS